MATSYIHLFIRFTWLSLFIWLFWDNLRDALKLCKERKFRGYVLHYIIFAAGMALGLYVVIDSEISQLATTSLLWKCAHFLILSFFLYPYGALLRKMRELLLRREEGQQLTSYHLARIGLCALGIIAAIIYEQKAIPHLLS